MDRVVGLVLTPHQSTLGSGEYFARAEAAAGAAGRRLAVTVVPSWHRAAGLAALLAAPHPGRPRRARRRRPGPAAAVFFTAHSLPLRVVAEGDTYPDQVAESGADIAALLDLDADPTVTWGTAWQSAGRTADPWIGPDLLVEMDRVAAEGATAVVVCPVGFVSDHLEVLYDLDIEALDRADALGIAFARTPSLNDDPEFLALLADVVRAAADGAPATGRERPGRAGPAGRGRGRRGHGRAVGRLGARPGPGATAPAPAGAWCSRPAAGPGGKVRSTEFAAARSTWPPTPSWPGGPRPPACATSSASTDALVAPGASGAALWARGRLRMMPDGVNLGRAHPVRGRWSARASSGPAAPAARRPRPGPAPPRRPAGRPATASVGDIVGARLGHEVVERLVDPLVGGHPRRRGRRPERRGHLPAAAGRRPAVGQPHPRPAPAAGPGRPRRRPGPGAAPPPVFWSLDGTATPACPPSWPPRWRPGASPSTPGWPSRRSDRLPGGRDRRRRGD